MLTKSFLKYFNVFFCNISVLWDLYEHLGKILLYWSQKGMMLLLPKCLRPVADVLTLIFVIYVLYMFVMEFAGLPRWYLQYFIWHIQVYLVLPVIGYLLLCKNPNTSLLKLVGIYQRRWLKRSEKILKRNNIIYTEIRFHRNLVKMHGIVYIFYKRMKAIVIKL